MTKETWHPIALTPDCTPEKPDDGQILLPAGAPDSGKSRLVVKQAKRPVVVKGGAHSDEHESGCARANLIKTLGEKIEYRAATTKDRFRHDGSFQLSVIIAVLTLLAAAGAGAVTITKALNDEKLTAPLWLILAAALVAFAAAAANFVSQVREA